MINNQILKRRAARRKLIDRVNQGIRASNLVARRQLNILNKPLNRNCINRAVQIARHPGPNIDFKAGDLDDLLREAGFRT